MSNNNVCPVCGNQAEVSSGGMKHTYDCPRCGRFILTEEAKIDVPNLCNSDYKKSVLSHHIRRSQINNSCPEFYVKTVENILNNRELPNVFEKCDFILEWVGNHSAFAGNEVSLYPHFLELAAFSGSINEEEVIFCLQALSQAGLASNHMDALLPRKHSKSTLTFNGWKRYDELKKGKLAYDKAFMAMKFKNEILTALLEDHFKPAVKQTGYELFRLDDKPEAGLIDIRMRQEIKTSKFIIADLTDDNLGAYWEAGFAEGLGKPVIYTCEERKFDTAITHFDVNHHLTIKWKEGGEQQAANDLKAAIRYTFPEARQQDE